MCPRKGELVDTQLASVKPHVFNLIFIRIANILLTFYLLLYPTTSVSLR